MTEVANRAMEPLSPWKLAGDGFAALSKIPAGVWLGWAVFAVYDGALRRLAWATGIIAPHHTESTWRYALWILAASLGMALASGPTFRTLLPGRPGPWRLDKGFLSYGLLGLAAQAAALVLALLPPTSREVPADGYLLLLALFRGLVGVVAYFMLLVIEVRLILWPIGLVLGDGEMTANRSWRLTRGQVLRFVVAIALAGVVPAVGALACAGTFLRRGDLTSLSLEEFFLVLGLVIATGVGAAFYRQFRPED